MPNGIRVSREREEKNKRMRENMINESQIVVERERIRKDGITKKG